MRKVQPKNITQTNPTTFPLAAPQEAFKELICEDGGAALALNNSFVYSDLFLTSISQNPSKQVKIKKKRVKRKDILGVFRYSFLKRIRNTKFFWKGVNPNYPSALMKLVQYRDTGLFMYVDLSNKLVNSFERFYHTHHN